MSYCLKIGSSKLSIFLTLYGVEWFRNVPLLHSGDKFEYIMNTSVTIA